MPVSIRKEHNMTITQAADYILDKVHAAGLPIHCVTLKGGREYTKEEAGEIADKLIQQAKNWK